jgi:hypothetical protein
MTMELYIDADKARSGSNLQTRGLDSVRDWGKFFRLLWH